MTDDHRRGRLAACLRASLPLLLLLNLGFTFQTRAGEPTEYALTPCPAVDEAGAVATCAAEAPKGGTQRSGASATRRRFVWPAEGPITTYFGEVDWTAPRGHAGLDISAPWGSPVVAVSGGQVTEAGWRTGYGLTAVLDHGDGLTSLYAHLSHVDVEGGDRVRRGQQLGLIGSTGFSTGPHLHLEMRQDGELRDPMKYLP